MVATILPMVYGSSGKTRNFPGLLVVHSLASTAGGLVLGLCVGYLSSLVVPRGGFSFPFIGFCVGSVAIAVSLKEAGLLNIRLPESRWRVPREWSKTKSPVEAVALYGFFLGFGLLTRMSCCLYPVLVWSAIQGAVETPIIVMLVFGFCRTIPIWLVYLSSENHDSEHSGVCAYSLSLWQPAAALFSAFGLVLVGSFFAIAALIYRMA